MKHKIGLFLLKAIFFFVLVVTIEYYRRFRFVFDDYTEKLKSILTFDYLKIFFIALAVYAVFFFIVRRKR